jgi:beta-lactamase superfamily II metal-dependent hydrolase
MAVFYLGVPLVVGAIRFRYHRAIGIVFVGTALGGWILSGIPIADGDRWRVTFLDVGQGDSALLQFPDGKTVLIDGGRRYERFYMGRGVIAPFLLNQGIRRLDHIIATHPQQDHVGGLPWMIRHLEVGEFWHTGIERSEPLFEELRQSVTSNEAKLANLTSENQEVESRISGLNQESTFVSRSESFPTLKTRISAIYPTWGFVTLAAGNTSGVVTSSPLNVVRDGEVIAKLLVTAVEANTASASIVPDSVGQDVVLMVGDQVVPGEKGAKAAPKEEAAPAPAPAPEPAAAPTASN